MKRIGYSIYETMEGGVINKYISDILIYNDKGKLIYRAVLVKRNHLPIWFEDFIGDPDKNMDRIMIYELQDGAKLMLHKYEGSEEKTYIEAIVKDPVFGTIINYNFEVPWI